MVLSFYELLAFWNFVHMMSYFNQSEFTLVRTKQNERQFKKKKITPWFQIWVNDGKWYTQIIRVNFNEAKKLNDSGNRENSKFSKLFYCSSVWESTVKWNIHKLQLVQNSAARIVKKFDHISEGRRSQKWLKVSEKILFINLVLAFKYLNSLAPTYVVVILQCTW